jgi:hypothetical protein
MSLFRGRRIPSNVGNPHSNLVPWPSDDYTSALKNGQLKFHVDSIDYQAQQSDLFESHFLFSMSQDLLELWLIQNDRSELVTELGVALED